MDFFGGFLSNDSSFGKIMTKCGTVFAINLLFVITCVPFFTVGAAFAAMYHAVFEMLDADTPINPFRTYLEGLRKNFFRATLVWMAFVGILLLGFANLTICADAGGWLKFLSEGVIAVMVAAAVVTVFLLPGLTLFHVRLKELLKLSLCAAMSRPPQTLLILALQIGPLALLYLDEINRPTYAFVGTFFGFALIACVVGKLLLAQFEPYFETAETDE